uniref:Uncharacterized protein n=1 Tax=Oryza barthii TaxID=65489 RepID=A0A0D3F9N9_9ORYZ
MSFLEATTSVSVATLVRINKFDGMHEGFAIATRSAHQLRTSLRGPVRVVNRYDNHFSVTCPVSGPMPQLVLSSILQNIAGTPVFNMRGEVVGLIELCSKDSYDIKFARNSTSVINQLQALFDEEDWLSALKRELVKRTST